MWWSTSVILALGKWRQENYEFEASLGYIEELCLKKLNTKQTNHSYHHQKENLQTNKKCHSVSWMSPYNSSSGSSILWAHFLLLALVCR
jgi:hypothetical protein